MWTEFFFSSNLPTKPVFPPWGTTANLEQGWKQHQSYIQHRTIPSKSGDFGYPYTYSYLKKINDNTNDDDDYESYRLRMMMITIRTTFFWANLAFLRHSIALLWTQGLFQNNTIYVCLMYVCVCSMYVFVCSMYKCDACFCL